MGASRVQDGGSNVKYPAKQLDDNRYINVEHDEWYGHIYEAFTERMEAIGIRVDKLYFDISYSQGDGACFEGKVEDWGKYLEKLGHPDSILVLEAERNWSAHWTRRGSYCHHRSLSFDNDIYRGENPYDEEDDHLRAAVWEACMNKFDLLELSKEIEENIQDHCRDLYKELLDEYEYQTSDEAVADFLELNEIEPLTEEE